MIKRTLLGFLAACALAGPALAQDDIEYPTPTPCYPFRLRRSVLTRQPVIMHPYDNHVFRVRVYTTPQQQPYYNVPPYAVITPY